MTKMDLIKDWEKIHESVKKNIKEHRKKNIYTINKNELEMTNARANLNALLLSVLPKEIKDKDSLFLKDGSSDNLHAYEQSIADRLFDEGYELDRVKEIIYELKRMIIKHTEMFNMEVNVDISMYDFIRMARVSDEMEEILTEETINKEMSAYEVIEEKHRQQEIIEKGIMDNKIDPFYTMLASGSGMRRPQFFDITTYIGIRPFRKEVYPYIIPESWINGLQHKESFWVENDSARNALILQKLHITKTGTFNKRVTMLNQPSYLNEDPDHMCDTINFTREKITKDNYERYIQTYYMEDGEPKLITRQNIKDLIGTEVDLRQPLTCTSDDGICRYCIGDQLYFDNIEGYKGGQRNLGAVVTKQKIAPKVQGYLSAKHNNTANMNTLKIKEGDSEEAVYYHELDHIFKLWKLDTMKFDREVANLEFLEPDLTRKKAMSSKIRVTFVDGETFVLEVQESYFYTTIENYNSKSNTVIDSSDLHMWITNNPVSSGYHALNKIFRKNDGKVKKAIDDLIGLMDDDKIVIPYLLIRNLIRDPDNNEKRPDFAGQENPPMAILSMSNAIKNLEELSLKMSIGWFKYMLSDVRNFRDETTIDTKFDVLFRSRKEGITKDYRNEKVE